MHFLRCCYREDRNNYNVAVDNKMSRVQLEQGELEGVVCGNYIAFKGIPYAKPPIGNLRFKAPQPPEPWEGIRIASQHGPVCPQYNERLDRIESGNEDCLYLNVYSKTLNPAKPTPVMVWIHGGAYYTGSGNSDFYGPEFFMDHDVILITFNYRLEVLGFLCLDNEDVPGNAGMKDQVAALKWVKKNISAFGGDPNNITIFGCSAGAASVSFHLLSKMSEGLFNKAVCQSGLCLHEWSYTTNARQRAFQLGKLLGKDTEDEKELLEFLRNIPPSSLVKIKLPFLETKYIDVTDGIMFGPVVEKGGDTKFLAEEPVDLIKRGQIANVPIIVGYTSGEGIEIGKSLPTLLGLLNLTGTVVPKELKFKWPHEKIEDADKKIRQYYFKDNPISEKLLPEVVKLETDRLFAYNIRRFARYHAKFSTHPVYLYKFVIETERNVTKKQYKMEGVEGVCHSDDLPYLFNITCLDVPLTDESRDVVKNIVQLWVNFATTSNPTSTSITEHWKPFSENESNCYIIDKIFKCDQNVDEQNMKFWDEIYGEVSVNGIT